ncbi:uncharacterized protein LOC115198945 [Salmo trutta]|uniref:uncharacterized protein LOC115198945 n=1 Tax=Salmo trutta TaxID=8032 RepID=UPI0011307360|nr:uncharacterized protein LOC115198945 [Salmo trutta]
MCRLQEQEPAALQHHQREALRCCCSLCSSASPLPEEPPLSSQSAEVQHPPLSLTLGSRGLDPTLLQPQPCLMSILRKERRKQRMVLKRWVGAFRPPRPDQEPNSGPEDIGPSLQSLVSVRVLSEFSRPPSSRSTDLGSGLSSPLCVNLSDLDSEGGSPLSQHGSSSMSLSALASCTPQDPQHTSLQTQPLTTLYTIPSLTRPNSAHLTGPPRSPSQAMSSITTQT